MPIFSISCGGDRIFEFKPKQSNATWAHTAKELESKTVRLELSDGALVIMGGDCQKTHTHAVDPPRADREKEQRDRINYTLRIFKQTQQQPPLQPPLKQPQQLPPQELPQQLLPALPPPPLPAFEAAAAAADDFALSLPPYRHPGSPPPSVGHWRNALWALLGERGSFGGSQQQQQQQQQQGGRDPRLNSLVFFEDEDVVCCYDGFPKATVHLLLMPKAGYFGGGGWSSPVLRPGNLTKSHLPLLRRFHTKARAVVAHLSGNCSGGGGSSSSRSSRSSIPISMGYHAVPSLEPLHLHIISDDLVAAALKKKEHYNSFVGAFFVGAAALEASLEACAGDAQSSPLVASDAATTARFDAEKKRPLACDGRSFTTMPELKRHLQQRLSRQLQQQRGAF
jgi:hypothetical protein